MSNIEDDMYEIKKLQEFLIFYKNHGWIPNIDRTIDIEKSLQAIKNILLEREQDKARIKELEEKNRMLALEGSRVRLDLYIKGNYIPKQKVKDILNEIQEEYNKLEEQFDCIWDKKSKDNYDRYKLQELSAMQQELGFVLGKFEELLEEGE